MGSRHLSRRAFIGSSLLLAGTALGSSTALSRTIGGEMPWTPGWADTPHSGEGGRFFTPEEAQCVDAITARLIPSDDYGAGAREADVVTFIDRQLAGSYGRGDRWYMQAPFLDGTDEQGYQAELAPAGLYRKGIESLDAHCRGVHEGRRFAELSPDEQDAILHQLEDGELELDGVPAGTFFELVLENAIEGFFCDPLYGGNRDMVGWRLVGFPGARYDYRDFLNHDGARIELAPVGLMGRPDWNPG